MAERIQGLSIGLDMETAGINRSLSEVKRSFRGLNSSIKTNTNNLKYGEKSTENYETAISSLNGDITKQQKNLDDLGKKHADAVREQGENSRAAQTLATEYNKQADNLNYLERQLESAKSEFAEFKKQQEIQSSALFKTGERLTGFGNGLQAVSGKAKDVGKSLTKWITMPAVGVASAAAGITAAFGWERLTGLDSAKAQLQGLGYNTEEVGRITDQVTDAIEGGMTTMAEGTQVAAGAMAAGVEEGAELERYIKLVGDAAVGANRPVADMAQIFNRVQGQGKLMTQELNMIEDGMPGFTQAMAESLNVPQEEFREMVTAGEVSSEEFLDVMDDFAGGMADAYAGSWKGMVANTKAYIGIIGENLLGGVFEKSKESIRQFVDLLSSDEVNAWAEQAGQKIGEMFSKVVDTVKSAITWFTNLSGTQKKVVASIGSIAVAAGPLLVAFGTIGGIIGKVASGLGVFATSASKAGGMLKYMKVGLAGLSTPITITVAAIAGLTAGFVLAYTKSETFRNIVQTGFQKIKETVVTVFNFLKPYVLQAATAIYEFFAEQVGRIKTFWDQNGAMILQAFKNVFNAIWAVVKPIINAIWAIFKKVMPAILALIKSVWGNIKGVISGALDVIMGVVKTFSGLFTGNFSKMWEGIKQLFSGAVKFVWNFVQLQLFGRLLKIAKPFAKGFKGIFSSLWSGIKTVFSTVIKWIVDFVKKRFTAMKNTLTSITNAVSNVITKIWNSIWGFFKKVIKSIVDFVKNRFTNLKNNTTRIFNGVKDMAGKVWNGIKKVTIDPVKSLVSTAKQKFSSFKTKVAEIFGNIKDGVAEKVGDMIQLIKDMPGKLKKGIKDGAGKVKDGFLYVASRMVDGIFAGVNGIIDGVNWAWEKLSGTANKFGHLKPTADWYVAHAKGTDSHPGGIAKVNDGRGSNAGQELIQTPDGVTGMFKGKDVYANLPKGTQVLSAKDTKNMIPNYAFGTKFIKKAWDKTTGAVKAGAKWTGEKAKAVGNKVKDGTMWLGKKAKQGAKAVLNTALKVLGIKTPGKKNDARGLARHGFLSAKDSGLKWLKDKIKIKQEEMEGGYNPFGKGFTMTSPYGMRGGKMHQGVDYAAAMGTPIKSATSGKVKFAGTGGPGSGYNNYGKTVAVKSGANEFMYTHMSQILKKIGDSISQGEVLGKIGSTGDSTGPHTHFEIRKKGQLGNTMDPAKFFGGSVSGSVKGWINKAMRKAGVSGKAWMDGLSYIISKESSGNPKATGAATSTGTAKGLMQIKDMNMSGDPYDPVNNVLNGIRYIKGRYGGIGSAVNWWKNHHWYASGGLINNDGMYRLAEGGYPEWVIPSDPRRRTEAMKLLALAGKDVQGNKRPNQLPNAGNNDNEIADKLDQLIELLARNSGQEFHFHNNGSSSPADNARKMKQVNRQLGMGL